MAFKPNASHPFSIKDQVLGYLSIQITPNISNDDTDCPEYINEFVKKNPQAKELKINYQNNENNDPISLEIDDELPLFMLLNQMLHILFP